MSTSNKQTKQQAILCCQHQCVHAEAVEKAQLAMPDIDTLYDVAELFKVFGDSTRIRILSALLGQELCVCDLCSLLDMTKSAISHQLRILRQTKLVKNRRSGKEVYYSLDDDHVATIISIAIEHTKE
ncbi:MAG: helix-turn-helix transcriptional regulator [Clostridia bacterium]|nr:helix-turn-helix transcriptional regulator [Clostridia bacterium]